MNDMLGRPTKRYHSFVLTLWEEGQALPNGPPVWRYSLENPHTGERIGFSSVDDVGRFLSQWVATSTAPDHPHANTVDTE